MNFIASWIYGQQQKKLLTNNDFTSTFDINFYDKKKRFYYWGLADFDASYSLKINQRYQAGAGVGYNILKDTNAYLNLSDGILYEKSDLSDTVSTHHQYETFRNSFRLRYHFIIWKVLVLDGTNFYQNSLSHRDDYIIKLNNSLSVKLKKWLAITTSVIYNKVSRTQSESFLLNYGITIEKYF